MHTGITSSLIMLHSLTLLSLLPFANVVPDGLYASEYMAFVWLLIVAMHWPKELPSPSAHSLQKNVTSLLA